MKSQPALVPLILRILHKYSWDRGLEILKQKFRSGSPEEVRELHFLAGWVSAERGAFDEAKRQLQVSLRIDKLAGWSTLGLVFVASREGEFDRARERLQKIQKKAATRDRVLAGAIAHMDGSILYHLGRPREALPQLRNALSLFGRKHFATGRVLDTLGMLYAGKDNFHAAEEFYRQAIDLKSAFDDQAGLAVTHGNLGRLYLDWGSLDRAEHHFHEDLRIAQKNLEAFGEMHGGKQLETIGETQMKNHLGQVALARADRATSASDTAAARRLLDEAAGWLDRCIETSRDRGWTSLEGFGRKDRALVCIAANDLPSAERHIAEAERLFRQKNHADGLAHVNRVWGRLRRAQDRPRDAFLLLRAALKNFEDAGARAEMARTQWEIARTHKAAGEPAAHVTQEYLSALQLAEASRRSELVEGIESEVRQVSSEALSTHVYQRVRGRGIPLESSSLMTGKRDHATVLYLDIKRSTDYALQRDPEEVMMTLNQMMAELDGVLRQHQGLVSSFRGDGFLALFCEKDHAGRAVEAGLDLLARLEEFNEPRVLLGLPRFEGRIGVASGQVVLGNVGTYDKVSYTAIGTTANLGARIEAEAQPGMPCISEGTRDLVSKRFVFRTKQPRRCKLKGLGWHGVWDVVGRAALGRC